MIDAGGTYRDRFLRTVGKQTMGWMRVWGTEGLWISVERTVGTRIEVEVGGVVEGMVGVQACGVVRSPRSLRAEARSE